MSFNNRILKLPFFATRCLYQGGDLPNLSSQTFRCGHHRGLFAVHKTNKSINVYVDENTSLCLYAYIQTNFLKAINNRIFFEHRQAFSMTNHMGSSGLQKMVYLPIFILTTDGTISCVMSDTWCQSMWYQYDDADPHMYGSLLTMEKLFTMLW